MKFLVVSDTHRSIAKTLEIYHRIKGIDAIIHLGDHIADARLLEKRLGIKVYAVPGNCDGVYDESRGIRIIESPGGKMLLTHGHIFDVRAAGLQKLYYKACEEGCNMVLYGHTHRASQVEEEGIVFLNPGSIEKPRDGSNGSYAVVESDEDGVRGSIIYYRPKRREGFIRKLLNYSDRF